VSACGYEERVCQMGAHVELAGDGGESSLYLVIELSGAVETISI
jgi:hypothetical protein